MKVIGEVNVGHQGVPQQQKMVCLASSDSGKLPNLLENCPQIPESAVSGAKTGKELAEMIETVDTTDEERGQQSCLISAELRQSICDLHTCSSVLSDRSFR